MLVNMLPKLPMSLPYAILIVSNTGRHNDPIKITVQRLSFLKSYRPHYAVHLNRVCLFFIQIMPYEKYTMMIKAVCSIMLHTMNRNYKHVRKLTFCCFNSSMKVSVICSIYACILLINFDHLSPLPDHPT